MARQGGKARKPVGTLWSRQRSAFMRTSEDAEHRTLTPKMLRLPLGNLGACQCRWAVEENRSSRADTFSAGLPPTPANCIAPITGSFRDAEARNADPRSARGSRPRRATNRGWAFPRGRDQPWPSRFGGQGFARGEHWLGALRAAYLGTKTTPGRITRPQVPRAVLY